MDLRDPGIEGWIETLAAAPGFKALRTLVFTPSEGAVFADGGCDRLLHAARAYSLPVFITCPGRVRLLASYAERFPDVQFVIDHCGVVFDALGGQATIDDAVARYPNVACKWAHALDFLSTTAYPFPDLEPKLRRAVDAFGPERVMWASDYTMIRRANWGEALFSIRHSPSLSEDEKAWIPVAWDPPPVGARPSERTAHSRDGLRSLHKSNRILKNREVAEATFLEEPPRCSSRGQAVDLVGRPNVR